MGGGGLELALAPGSKVADQSGGLWSGGWGSSVYVSLERPHQHIQIGNPTSWTGGAEAFAIKRTGQD